MSVFSAFGKATATKEAAGAAHELAMQRRPDAALALLEEALSTWSATPSLPEKLVRKALLGDALTRLTKTADQYRAVVRVARERAEKGQDSLRRAEDDPFDLGPLQTAQGAFEESLKLVDDVAVMEASLRCDAALAERCRFLDLVNAGDEQAGRRYYRLAIEAYEEAEALCGSERVRGALEACRASVGVESEYEGILQDVHLHVGQEHYRLAVRQLQSGLARFSREDGLALMEHLRPLAEAQGIYHEGLTLEHDREWLAAAKLYERAVKLAPSLAGPRLRLGLLAIRASSWERALHYVEGLPGDQPAYVRGFAQAKLGQFQLAHRSWQGLNEPTLHNQREVLKSISQRQRLRVQQAIENHVGAGALDAAKTLSGHYVQTFGADPIVNGNLEQHILPRLESEMWQSGSWRAIADYTRRQWQDLPSSASLHNWAVAAYYAAQEDDAQCGVLITAWYAAIANLSSDPALQDLPWRAGDPIDARLLGEELLTLLDRTIEGVKSHDIDAYTRWRDQARMEQMALQLMSESPTGGPRVQGLLVGPGALASNPLAAGVSRDPLQAKTRAGRLLAALYTPWGPAVAACLLGDVERAISLRPAGAGPADDEFARRWVAYHEGMSHLQHKRWRQAVGPLREAKALLADENAWQEDIERLCAAQRQAISDEAEHVEFAQFWRDLLNSQAARGYLVEYKTHEIRQRMIEKRLTPVAGLGELEKLKAIDARNPVLLELIEMAEFQVELDKVKVYIDRGDVEGLVGQAKRSSNVLLRRRVSEMCLNMMEEGMDRRTLHPQAGRQLIIWAYELCPDYPGLRELYYRVR